MVLYDALRRSSASWMLVNSITSTTTYFEPADSDIIYPQHRYGYGVLNKKKS
jgi:hypothetical protein